MSCASNRRVTSASDVADGFQLVTTKTWRKRRRNRHQQASSDQRHTQQDGEDDSIDLTKLEKKILASKEELRCSEFFSTVKDIFRHVRRGDLDWEKVCVPGTQDSPKPSCGCEELKSTWDRDSAVVRQEGWEFDAIVCYGLGRFSSCVTARFQLGLLLLLMEVLHIPGSCYVYDPVFSSSEKLLLEKLGCQRILTNEEGKRPVDRRTLFYMPHCGKPLYNNLLWANWGQQLSKLVILGNSLSNMALRFPRQELEKSAFYIHSILDYTKEIPLPNNFHFLDVFNDLSLHVFPVTDTSPPPSLWQQVAEPVYDLDWQEEIITSWNK
ncbi:SRR1-like protein [Branchiostoma lanceolatum]|uniref:SRR1-like protein n=1 Tax=Branchiostoma lanceolatum TaxID=7740 RepID=UPI003451D5D1